MKRSPEIRPIRDEAPDALDITPEMFERAMLSRRLPAQLRTVRRAAARPS